MRKIPASHALRLPLLLLAFLAASPACRAAFLQLPGIAGGSTDSTHLQWIDVSSFAFNVRPSTSELTLVKLVDRASPLLALRTAQGTHLTNAVIQFSTPLGNGALVQYQITLANVTVAAVKQQGIGPAASSATEQCTLRFSSLSWNYFEQIFLNVSGTQNPGAGTVTLQWTAIAGKTYDILGSSQVDGVYSLVGTISATQDGPMTLTVPANGDRFFYRLRTTP